MNKKLFIFISLVFIFSTSYGAFLKNVPQTIIQPDGSVIHCFASGDEYHHWLHDSAGYTIVINESTGFYTYAQKEGETLMASNYIVGKVNPENVGLVKGVNISEEQWLAKRKAFEAAEPARPVHKTAGRNHGQINNLVFFIRFSDESGFNSGNYNTIRNQFNDSSSATANSLYNYYKTISYGNLFVTTHLYPQSNSSTIYSFQDIYPRNYYIEYNASTNPNGYSNSSERTQREHDLLTRVVQFFQDSIPTSLNLDYDGDNRVDNVCFVTSGSPNGWSDLLWPHRWSLYSSNVTINGKRVYDYNLIMETYMYTGIITHEFMHTLGAPDLYHYNSSYNNVTPVGPWDLMASTNYSKPQGLSAYMKYKYGNWLESIPTIDKCGTYTLYPANGSSNKNIAYKIPIEDEYNQYLVLEYRKITSSTFESSLDGSGIVIYRIDENYNGNSGYNGSSTFDEVYVFRPGGTTTNQGSITLAYFNEESGRTNFNETTNPSPFFTEGYAITGISISNITRAIDSIRFTIGLDTTTLSIDTNYMSLENKLNFTDTFHIFSNDSWHLSCDTNWLTLSETEGTGDKKIYVTIKQHNTTTIKRSVELSIIASTKIESITIIQAPIIIDTCLEVSNLFESDTLVQLAFSVGDSIFSASEYFSIFDEMNIDSVSIYLGDVNFSANDSLIIRIVNTSSIKYPTSLLKKYTFPANKIIPNAWNTFALGGYKTIKHFCIDYVLPLHSGGSDSVHFVFAKNSTLRNYSLATAFLKEKTTWNKIQDYTGDDRYYSSPIRLYLCPSDLSIDNQPIQQDATIILYPNPTNDKLEIKMEGITSTVEIKIYNISGQLLYVRPEVNPLETQSISVSNLPAGMYFLKINSSKLTKVKSFVVE